MNVCFSQGARRVGAAAAGRYTRRPVQATPDMPDSSTAAPRALAAVPLDLVVSDAAPPGALFGFRFAAADDDDPFRVGCPPLPGAAVGEQWLASVPPRLERHGRWRVHRAGAFAVLAVSLPEHDGDSLEQAAEQAYRELLELVRTSPHPHLLRIWNHFAAINAGEGDEERYRRFCVGRARSLDAAFDAAPPAATAIGTIGEPDRLQVVALAGTEPGLAIENPRQTPAWRYPRDYGPVSPGFSRATLVGQGARARLLVSGTASIVGHRSCHPDDVMAQLDETLRNLDALLEQASMRAGVRFGLDGARVLRAYLREPDAAPAVRQRLAAVLDPARCLLLHGEVCRRELLVEIEGVFAPASAG